MNNTELLDPSLLLKKESRTVDSFYANLLDSLYDGVYFVDDQRRITYWNRGAEHLSGYTADEVLGKFCYDNLLMHANGEGCVLCTNGCPLHMTLADGIRRDCEVFLRHKLGHRVPVSVRVSPIHDATGKVIGAVEVFSDISVMKLLERKADELQGLAYFDSLTGVANRRYIELKVCQSIEEVEQFDRAYGIILIDVDEFKAVNDTFGHGAGDHALKAISDTLTRTVRPGDIVGRWGGDEFLVLVRDVNANSLLQLADRCRDLISQTSFVIPGTTVRFTVSLGATLLRPADTCEVAVHRADELLYAGKTAGKNSSRIG